jgi:hypothetical protein
MPRWDDCSCFADAFIFIYMVQLLYFLSGTSPSPFRRGARGEVLVPVPMIMMS